MPLDYTSILIDSGSTLLTWICSDRLQESSLSSGEISKLKGTGKNGMLTKGDVLVALGQVKSPYGSAEKMSTDILGPSGKRKSEVRRALLQLPALCCQLDSQKDLEYGIGADISIVWWNGEGGREGRTARRTRSSTLDPLRNVESHPTFQTHHRSQCVLLLLYKSFNELIRDVAPRNLPLSPDSEFDVLLAPYASLLPPPQPRVSLPTRDQVVQLESVGQTSRKDEWAGLM